MRNVLILALLVMVVGGCAQSSNWQDALEARFDETLPAIMEEGHVPGAVILVGHLEDGEWVTWCKAYGYLQLLPEPIPMPEDAIFDLASMSKATGAGTAMMILQDRGLVSVDDPVSMYLDEYNTDEKRDVTIRNLMTHSSGLQSYIGAAERAPIVEEYGNPCRDALRAYIRNISLRHLPVGDVYVYSCLNAITTAMIVERVSGQTLDEFTMENIWEPLGMVDTDYSPGPGPRVVPTQQVGASGEFLWGMVHDPLANLQEGVSGNAGVFSTAQDLSIYAQMMLQGGERNGVRILSEEAVEQMTSSGNDHMHTVGGAPVQRGLLWDLYGDRPGDIGLETHHAFGHTGYTGTAIRMYPEENLYIIALTNRVHPDDTGNVTGLRHHVWVTVGDVVLGVPESVVYLKDATPLMRLFGD